MVDGNIVAPQRDGNCAHALSAYLVNAAEARRYRKARQDLLDRAPCSGDTIAIEDAAAVLDWHGPTAIVELLYLLDRGKFVADFQNADDRTIVLRRL
ncbi:hypothetical protein ACLNGM_17505 [Aureimonas phyllosphaerae]|uniref:hypothetical protein n=1 Tax=Aureimonas phyllosphaerae TaxID=1166078 RepID=UPI0025FEF452|nr:hypothetical protein [uncultured Aureimonas sp.]